MPTALLLSLMLLGFRPSQQLPGPASALSASIDALGSFDLATRTAAGRTLRRAAADVVIPLLEQATRDHRDQYARFRAFVLLTGFDDPTTGRVARDMLRDRNDRVRTVAYQWFEHHPDGQVLAQLVEALPGETSVFVRPALTRALAAYRDEPRARQALLPLVTKGEDLFRGSVIDALGSYQARYAFPDILAVAQLDGPLQDDAITAVGRIGDPASRIALGQLQASAPRELQPTISAALCLVGVDCPAREAYLQQTLAFAASNDGYQPLLRGAVHALGALAATGQRDALTLLFDAGIPAREEVRAPIALGVGLVALRSPLAILDVMESRPELDGPIGLLLEAFDMLSEDFEEERFYSQVRRAYWAAPEGSARRRVAEALIQKLEY